jgi:hypothetical protein
MRCWAENGAYGILSLLKSGETLPAARAEPRQNSIQNRFTVVPRFEHNRAGVRSVTAKTDGLEGCNRE